MSVAQKVHITAGGKRTSMIVKGDAKMFLDIGHDVRVRISRKYYCFCNCAKAQMWADEEEPIILLTRRFLNFGFRATLYASAKCTRENLAFKTQTYKLPFVGTAQES